MRDMLQMLYWAVIWRMCSNTRRLPKKNGVCGMLFYPRWSWWSVWSTNGWGIPWFLDLWFGDWWVNIPTPVGHRRSMSNPQELNWSSQVFTEGLENSNCVGNLCQVFLPLAPICFFTFTVVFCDLSLNQHPGEHQNGGQLWMFIHSLDSEMVKSTGFDP